MRKLISAMVIGLTIFSVIGVAGSDRAPTTILSEITPPVQNNFDPDSEVRGIISRINESVIANYIQALQNYRTRYYQTRYSWDSASYIYDVMKRHNIDVSYQEFRFSAWRQRNVIGEMRGTDAVSNATYIICGHYDSTSTSAYWDAPGADDNGSGTAAVLAAAEVLSQYSFNHTIRFIAFGCEEAGCWGSKYYAAQERAAGANISGVLNLDMVAYNPTTTENVIKIRTNVPSEDLANYTSSIAAKYYPEINLQVNKAIDTATNSDHAWFWPDYKAIHFFENTTGNPNYHKPTDTIGYLNLTYAANSTQLAMATLCELAELNTNDSVAPILLNRTPAPSGWGSENPEISCVVSDPSGVNASDIGFWVNGSPASHSVSYLPFGLKISTTSPWNFYDLQNVSIRVVANDSLGNMMDGTWNFTADAIAPSAPTNISISLVPLKAERMGLVLDVGANGSYNGLYDSLHMLRPWVIQKDGEYKMWYAGEDGTGTDRILYANSSDGTAWTKHGLVLDIGAAGENDSRFACYPSVLWDGEYKMWYGGYDGANWRVMYANSSNGLNWTKQGVVITNGSYGSYDYYFAYCPSVIQNGTGYRMWYAGSDGVAPRICYADSADGLAWAKKGVVLNYGVPFALDGHDVSEPFVAFNGTSYIMWYDGWDGQKYKIMEAVSDDGLNWRKNGVCVPYGGGGDLDWRHQITPGGFVEGNDATMYYAGYSTSNYRIFKAVRTPETDKDSLLLQWSPPPSNESLSFNVRFSSNWSALSSGMGENASADLLRYFVPDAGDGNETAFYAKISAADRAGHTVENWTILAKVGCKFVENWSLVGDPFGSGGLITDALSSVKWDYVMAYNASDATNRWRTNYTGRADFLDDITFVEPCQGLWVRANSSECYATAGAVRNWTIHLSTGYNLVAMPFARQVNASEVMSSIGPSCSVMEGFDANAIYRTKILSANDLVLPGMGYWLYMTSETDWIASNY